MDVRPGLNVGRYSDDPTYTTVLVWPTDEPQSPVARAWVELLRKAATYATRKGVTLDELQRVVAEAAERQLEPLPGPVVLPRE